MIISALISPWSVLYCCHGRLDGAYKQRNNTAS